MEVPSNNEPLDPILNEMMALSFSLVVRYIALPLARHEDGAADTWGSTDTPSAATNARMVACILVWLNQKRNYITRRRS